LNQAHRRRRLAEAIFLMLSTAAAEQAAAQSVTFDLPAEEAVTTIPLFGRQANLQILAPADQLLGIRTHAVQGTMEAREALRQLLEGTGLFVAADDGRTIILRLETPREAGPDTPSNFQGREARVDEIMVTATRRSESLQDVPIALTAISGSTLQQLNVLTFDDLAKYVPGVTTAGTGPGQSEIYIRGVSTSRDGPQVAGAFGAFPNVAVYLDDQSVQLPGRNLDIYMADMQRIEVLAGPQGTLYGAGAEAGAIRYITNPVKLNQWEGTASASYSFTAHGDPNSSVQAVLNIPVIDDVFALRALVYNDRRGGYITNVPGTFTRSATDGGIVNYFGGVVPANSATLSNYGIAGGAFNPVSYSGARLSGLFQFDRDWSLLVQQSDQNLQADGSFAYDPLLGDLAVMQYNPSSDKDRFGSTAWTLNGRVGALKLVYAGSYLVRNIDQVADYTAYSRGQYADYYQCDGPRWTRGASAVCYSPSAYWHDVERNTHQSHEVRISTPDQARVRGIAGVFWEQVSIESSQNFSYGDEAAGFAPIGPAPGVARFDPGVRPAGVVYFTDLTRGYRQRAAFGELSVDLIPDRLTLSAGTRIFRFDNFEKGQNDSAHGCRHIDPCAPPDGSFQSFDLTQVNTGHKQKIDVSFKAGGGIRVYASYSEGFRPGGFNHNVHLLLPSSPLYGKFSIPSFYGSDGLNNYEIGWKTQLLSRRLQFNGAVYWDKWEHAQIDIYDPGLYGNSEFIVNGPNYRIRGVQTDATWRATEQLTLSGVATWNQTAQLNEPSVQGLTGVIPLFPTRGVGTSLANAPPFQGTLRVRYEFPVGGVRMHFDASGQHTAHSYASVVTQGAFGDPSFDLAAYSSFDAAAGFASGVWEVEAYAQNLTDSRGELYKSSISGPTLTTVSRPRTVGIRFSLKIHASPRDSTGSD
jgi:iron complex outermembrane recepter protein